MGRIADEASTGGAVRPNKVDRILESLDDDDRAVVMAWLHDDEMGDVAIELQLWGYDIAVSDSTIRTWRRRRGIRTVWAA